jgi:hypothetical protein
VGATSVASTTAVVVIDTAVPAAPVVTASSANTLTPTVAGTSEAFASVEVYIDGVLAGTATANAVGAWTLPVTVGGTATYLVTAKAIDAAGSVSPLSAAATLVIDVSAPVAPTMAALTTYSLTPTLTGTAEANSTVRIYDGTTLLGTAVADGSGNWTFTVSPALTASAHSFTATATDAAGNTGVASPEVALSGVWAAIVGGADSNSANNNVSITASQFASIGITQIDSAAAASLLSDVLDGKASASVDTASELSSLADIVAAIALTAAGGTPSPALTPADFAALGLTGVTTANLADILAAIAATPDNGSGISSLASLQATVTSAAAASAAKDAALATISAYANGGSTAPSVSDFADAGVTGVDSSNLAAINALIASLSGTDVDSPAELQAVIDAYLAVLAAADGTRNNNATLTSAQFASLGMSQIDSAVELSLMNRVLDTATSSQVDTGAELQALGDTVAGIFVTAAGGTASPAVTAAGLAAIGLTGVTSSNLAAILDAIAATNNDGSEVDTIAELQALVDQIVANAKAAALAVITAYDGTNTAPTLADYENAGIVVPAGTDIAAINSVIAVTASAGKDSVAEVQNVLDTYATLLTGADGNAANNNVTLTASQYALLGVTTIDSAAKASLLNDVIDGKSSTSVDTQAEIAALASIVARIFEQAAGGTPNPPLTAADLAALGLTGVTTDNLAAILAAIAATADNGSGVSTLSALQTITTDAANAASAALAVISAYDGTNTTPAVADYVAAGVTGVQAGNLTSINSVIAGLSSGATDTAAEVQAVVDAYNAILNAADGTANGNANLSAAQFQTLGLSVINTNAESLLMNAIVDTGSSSSVDTLAKLQELARIVDAISQQAAGLTPSPALTAADLALLGITGVTDANLAATLAAIAATADDGSGVNSLAKLQAVASDAAAQATAAAIAVISSYAGSAPAPTSTDYANAGVSGVSASNLAIINSAIAPLSSAATDSSIEIQAVVDAYTAVIAAADGLSNGGGTVTQSQFESLGLSMIDSTPATALLNSIIDSSALTAVDTQAELVAMATTVAGVIATANGQTATPALTVAALTALGITGVTASNLSYVLAAFATAGATGVDSLSELQSVTSAAAAAALAGGLSVISSYDGTNTAPTVTDFTNAEVTGVTFANIGSINSVLGVVSASASDTTAEIQPIVDAYAKVMASADGISNSGSPLNATDFASLGLPAIDTSAKVALMNELIDASTFAAVDTQGELAALADIVAAIIATSSGSTPAVALTVGSFAAIGITGIDAINLPLMIAAIEASDDDTSGVNTLAKIQAMANQVISTQNAALAVISQYDGNNAEPQISTFTNLGITGVDATNVAAINAYLASISATRSDTIAEVQALVDAFLAVIAAADGNANATPLGFGAAQFALIGVPGIDQAAEITLMNAVVGGLTNADIDTTEEITEIARVVEALMLTAAAGTPAQALTAADLALLGITGVDASNLALFLAEVAESGVDGLGIDSLAELQALSDQVNAAQDAAIALIAAYDGTTTAPTFADFTAAGLGSIGASAVDEFNVFLAGIAAADSDTFFEVSALLDSFEIIRDYTGSNATPTTLDFINLGITGVDASNLAGINSFLATMPASLTDSPAELQALVDAYILLAPGVDGIDNDNVTLTLAQWQALGFVDAVTDADVAALNDLFDTLDWTVSVDAGAASSNGLAALAALRIAPRSASEPGVAAIPTPTPAPTASNAPAPAATASPIPVPTRKPVVKPTTNRPVYEDAPTPGDGISEVSPGEIAAVVDGQEERAGLEILNGSTLRITLPQGVILQVSSILTDGKPAKVASDGALLVVQGTSVDISGSGYRPGSLVDLTIYSTPTRLGTVTVEADGGFRANFPIPAGIEPGDHTIKIDGTSAAGELTTVSVGVRVLPKSQESSVEAADPSPTATNSAGLSDGSGLINGTTGVVLGALLVLLLLGFMIVAARRRRSESR